MGFSHLGYGGDIFNADYTKTSAGPPARQAWQFAYDLMFVDKSMPDSNTTGQYGGDLFLAGKAAMTTIGHWAVPSYAEAGFAFDAAPMPVGPAGQATSVNSAGFVIAKGSKFPDASWQFLKFVISPAAQTRLAEMGSPARCLSLWQKAPSSSIKPSRSTSRFFWIHFSSPI